MENKNKKSLSYKIQKNPFLIGLILIIGIVVLIAVFSLSSALQKKTKELSQTTAAPTTTEVQTTEKKDYTVALDDLKTYNDSIKSTKVTYQSSRVVVSIEYKDKAALLDAHYAKSAADVNVRPIFYFFINHGTEVKCPGEMKFLDDGVTVEYYLSKIDDLKNAVALTDEMTLTYENLLTVSFNLYIEYKDDTKTEIGRTLVGSYFKSMESLRKDSPADKTDYSSVKDGIKKVELVSCEKFAWLDIYFEDEASYKKLNYDFKNNFISFNFEDGGKKFDWQFIVTKYDDIYMLRCKFDTYSLKELVEKTGNEKLTVTDLFAKKMTITASDYDKTTDFFVLNSKED